jgi:hypothetical protein
LNFELCCLRFTPTILFLFEQPILACTPVQKSVTTAVRLLAAVRTRVNLAEEARCRVFHGAAGRPSKGRAALDQQKRWHTKRTGPKQAVGFMGIVRREICLSIRSAWAKGESRGAGGVRGAGNNGNVGHGLSATGRG